MVEKHYTGEIVKTDPERRIAYGWASVIEENGKVVVDSDDDIIKIETLYDTAHDFITVSRAGKVMHQGKRAADVVESVVFSHDLQKALGIDLGKVGWFIGMKIHDEELWKAVKDGELRAFSIGGHAE